MKLYSDKISLVENSMGIYCIDTTMGCTSGMNTEGGCYNDCYAAKSAKTYGYDFSKTVLRKFYSEGHKREILSQVAKIKMDFIRIGASGDPSENWQHTINVIKILARCNKEIVIITKHWDELTDLQLEYLSTQNICINTSVSALDSDERMAKALFQYNRIKPYCKSVLRIVSCDFNLSNPEGLRLSKIQHDLFKNTNTIDTVIRPSKSNQLVVNGIINVKKEVFNGNKQLASRFNRKTFMGKCSSCQEMCGQRFSDEIHYLNKRKLVSQLSIF